MKQPDAPLSPAQQEIMEIVWELGEVAAIEVQKTLSAKREVAKETVRTTLQRMEEKGWLKHRVVGRTYFYSAVVGRDARTAQKVTELIDTLCGGSAERMMTALLDHRGLSDDEARRIEATIRKARTAKKSGD